MTRSACKHVKKDLPPLPIALPPKPAAPLRAQRGRLVTGSGQNGPDIFRLKPGERFDCAFSPEGFTILMALLRQPRPASAQRRTCSGDAPGLERRDVRRLNASRALSPRAAVIMAELGANATLFAEVEHEMGKRSWQNWARRKKDDEG